LAGLSSIAVHSLFFETFLVAVSIQIGANFMSNTPLVSIGLFVYNGDRFLEAALDSILDQTFRDFELIISDNCSTDRSDEICRRYAARDPRIRYYRNDRNMGAGWNLRNVYFKATGKYFKWAAHDDMIQPDFLRLCVDALEADDSVVIAHTLTRIIDDHGQFVEDYEWRLRTESPDPVVRFKDLLLNDHLCYQIFGVMRMSALRMLPPQGSYVNSDGVLLAQMGLIGRFYETPELLFLSTRHSNQSMQVKPVRLKSPRFRLTNRHGTLPSPEWWDPSKTSTITFPEWRMFREYFLSIAGARIPAWQRLRCYLLLLPWLIRHARRMGKDMLIAADQVLFRLQMLRAKAAQPVESSTSMDVAS
jgi:glycosyltransferase involved in cell wall biosynthesis